MRIFGLIATYRVKVFLRLALVAFFLLLGNTYFSLVSSRAPWYPRLFSISKFTYPASFAPVSLVGFRLCLRLRFYTSLHVFCSSPTLERAPLHLISCAGLYPQLSGFSLLYRYRASRFVNFEGRLNISYKRESEMGTPRVLIEDELIFANVLYFI